MKGGHDPILGPLGVAIGAMAGGGRIPKLPSQTQHGQLMRSLGGHALYPHGHGLDVGQRRALCHPQGHLPRAGLAPLEGEEQRRTDQGGPRHARTETRRTQVTPNPKGIPPLQTGREGKGERGEGRDELPRARRVAGGPTP